MYQKVKIQGLLLDPITERPILVLKEDEASRILPIWIGTSEANAIALQLENIKVPRPMTHDLLCGILSKVNSPLKEVRICDLRDNTYFADIILSYDGGELHVDSRPSDAIALAVRTGVPIFVEDSIFQKSAEAEDFNENLRQWLQKLSPDELGRYEM
jgi:bifunctional DNase/RNase